MWSKFSEAFLIVDSNPDNIRMGLKEIGINTRIWIDWAQDRDYWRVIVNAALNFRVA